MVDEVQVIDLQAFTAIDQRRLLRVLSRAIDEEAGHLYGELSSGEWSRNRARLRVFCNLVSMIREMDESGSCLNAPGSERKASRTL